MLAHSFLSGVIRCGGIVTRRNSSLRSSTSWLADRGTKAGRVGSSADADCWGAVGRSEDGAGGAESSSMSSSESSSESMVSSAWAEARAEPTAAAGGWREGPAWEELGADIRVKGEDRRGES